MRKLNNKKVAWIVRQMDNGGNSETIARIQKITQRRVQQIYRQYKTENQTPKLKKCGKPKSEPLTEEQRKLILQEHTDWFEYNGKHIIAYLDDSSRRILSCGEFDNETTENSIIVLDKAIRFAKSYDGIIQLITDHGTQFTANKKDKDGEADHRFEEYVKSKGIELIHSRIKHPQTNGKIEKWFDLFNRKRHLFKSLKEFVDWYNEIKPHRSLDFERAETPSEAFRRKIRTEVFLGQAAKLFRW